MKRVFFVLFVLMTVQMAWAGDVVKLVNERTFTGEVKRIDDCQVVFKTQGQRYFIPAQDILFIRFEDPHNPILVDYQAMSDPDKCMKGHRDADLYHGKAGLNIAMGVLFGPFAVIGAALTNPRPERGKETMMLSQNKELFDDAEYLQCYKKKAKRQNAGNAALGWLAWVLILLL